MAAGEGPRWTRGIQVALRSVHIAAMGLVLGGIWLGGGYDRLRTAILAAVASGLLLALVDLFKGPGFLLQGSGAALLLKLALLGLGNWYSGARLEWYLAATLVASVGSHMPGSWRHFSFLEGRALE
ncbi:MAG: hypothetical protein ABSH53_15715 [Holophaga sp.]|jgi:hypothetical protein